MNTPRTVRVDGGAITEVQRLRQGQFVRVARPQGLRVRAERGTLWLTQDGRPRDVELEPGQCACIDDDAPLLVGTLGGDAMLTLTRAPRPRRLWLARLIGRLASSPRPRWA